MALKKMLKQNPITGNAEILHDFTVEVYYVSCSFGEENSLFGSKNLTLTAAHYFSLLLIWDRVTQ
jgi:hypothetical protein